MNKKSRRKYAKQRDFDKEIIRVYVFYLSIDESYRTIRKYGDEFGYTIKKHNLLAASPTSDGMGWLYAFKNEEDMKTCKEEIMSKFNVKPKESVDKDKCFIIRNGILFSDYPVSKLN